MSHNDSKSSSLLLVSTLDVHLKAQARKQVESVVVNAGAIKKEIHREISPGGSHQERFDPPLEILHHTKILVSIRYRGALRGNVVSIALDPKTVLSEANEQNGKLQTYRKTEGDIEVAIGIQSLHSTSHGVSASCPRFRVLIIGESGVGKSSLINKAFGISSAGVCDTTRGEANVEREYVARDDPFVVHDSCGFESADHHNLDAACDFISGRRCMRDLNDQLHAVWLCLEIPFAGGRLIEAGVEKFLKDKENILGKIPLIVVFTKLDLLENMLRAEALVKCKLLDQDTLQGRKQALLERSCLAPVQTVTGNASLPYVTVSTSEGYEGGLTALVKDTKRIIQKYIEDEAAHYVPTVARRMNVSKSH